ncbi:hypothetical protein [Mycobacterium sp.]|uniref:hypothetical protein n=1 Tax=Mycobacterium sp. TaxID=1785 RepID=UPI0025D1CCB7|nr:hypothetical protein [Mycobacterium sp.]
MSNHYEWGMAREGGFQVVTRESAAAEWDLPEPDPLSPWTVGVTSSFALGVFNANGDGTILEGEPEEILHYADRLHAHAHRQLDGLADFEHGDETRSCALCGDQVLILSSRDWCDGCEATAIPADVWQAFLVRHSTTARHEQGDMSLSAVVDELTGMSGRPHP